MINDDDDSEIIQSWSAQTPKHSSATGGFPTLFLSYLIFISLISQETTHTGHPVILSTCGTEILENMENGHWAEISQSREVAQEAPWFQSLLEYWTTAFEPLKTIHNMIKEMNDNRD